MALKTSSTKYKLSAQYLARRKSSVGSHLIGCLIEKSLASQTAILAGQHSAIAMLAPASVHALLHDELSDFLVQAPRIYDDSGNELDVPDYCSLERGRVIILKEFSPGRGEDFSDVNDRMIAAIAKSRAVIFVVERRDDLPEDLAIMLDGVVNFPFPSRQDIAKSIRAVTGEQAKSDQLDVVQELVLHDFKRVFWVGRDLESAVRRATGILRLRLDRENRQDRIKDDLDKEVKEILKEQPPKENNLKLQRTPSLDDLHGLGEAADWGRELAQDIADYRAKKISWGDVDRGVLLSGPPGTGKTTYARALGKTCDLPVFAHSFAQWQAYKGGHLGDMLKAMRSAFEEATKSAPCILFIDEVDGVGDRNRLTGNNSGDTYWLQVVNAFLECLDGSVSREGVVVVGACNNPTLIDEAVTRAGRLDRHIKIELPDAAARAGILRYHLRDDLAGDDLMPVALRADGKSGADIEQLVRDARRIARRARRSMIIDDLIACLPELHPLDDKDQLLIAIHEAGHAVVSKEFGHEVEKIGAASVMPGTGGKAGATLVKRRSMIFLRKIDVIHDVAQHLAGLVAEEVILGERTDGGGSTDPTTDLNAATIVALRAEIHLGLGTRLSTMVPQTDADFLGIYRRDERVQIAVEETLQRAFRMAKLVVRRHKKRVLKLAEALLEHGVLEGEELQKIMSDPGLEIGGHIDIEGGVK